MASYTAPRQLIDSYVGDKGIQPQTANRIHMQFWWIFFSSTSYHSNGQASVEPKHTHFFLSAHKKPTHPTTSTMPPSAEMLQKAANAANTTLSLVTTPLMPSKTCLNLERHGDEAL
jgi:hypothetical protein